MPILQPLSGGQSSKTTSSKVLQPLTTTKTYVQPPITKKTVVKTTSKPVSKPISKPQPNLIQQAQGKIQDVVKGVNFILNPKPVAPIPQKDIVKQKPIKLEPNQKKLNPEQMQQIGIQPANLKNVKVDVKKLKEQLKKEPDPVIKKVANAIIKTGVETVTDVKNAFVETGNSWLDIPNGLKAFYKDKGKSYKPKDLSPSAQRGVEFIMSFGKPGGFSPELGAVEGNVGFLTKQGVSKVTDKILSKLPKGEVAPEKVIQAVIDTKTETTAEGKALVKASLEAKKQGKNIVVEQKPPIESSVVQYVNQKTGAKEFQTIPKGQLEQFKTKVDNSGGTEVIDSQGRSIHLTAKTPEQMIEKGFTDKGIADIKTIPEPKTRAEATIKPNAANAGLTKGENWRVGFQKTNDVFRQKDILKAVANGKSTPQELTDILNKLEPIVKDTGSADIAYDVSQNPAATQAIKNRAIKIYEGNGMVMPNVGEAGLYDTGNLPFKIKNPPSEFIKEGAKPTTIPIEEFNGANAQIYPTQNTVDRAGVNKWKKAIQAGERPQVVIDFDKRTDNWRVVDGHTKLVAYQDLGIKDIPVVDNTGGKFRVAQPTIGDIKPKIEAKTTTPPPPEKPVGDSGGVLKPSKIGKSIEAKAVEARLTKGFEKTAGYEPQVIKEQAAKATDLINNNYDEFRKVIRGETKTDINPLAVIKAAEEHLKINPNPELAYELANSPLVTKSSEAAQVLRFAAEREQDSFTKAAAQIRKAREEAVQKRYASKSIQEVKDKFIKNGKAKIAAPKFSDWSTIIKEVRC